MGEFVDGTQTGVGHYRQVDKVYEGSFSQGRKHGLVFLKAKRDLVGMGNYVRGKKNGYFYSVGDPQQDKPKKLEIYFKNVVSNVWFIREEDLVEEQDLLEMKNEGYGRGGQLLRTSQSFW